MFRQVVRTTQMTTDAACDFFNNTNKNIIGESYQGDVSFVSTLRALVLPRMNEGEQVYLRFADSNYTAASIDKHTKIDAVTEVINVHYYNPGTIIVHDFNSRMQDDNNAWMRLMESSFTSVFPGWHRLEKVTDFFRKVFYTLCFINPDTKSVVIFTENLDIRKMHYLQCSIFAFMPWYFDPSVGVSKIEMELIESLRGKDASIYEDCIARIAEQYNFRDARIRSLLAGFETRYESKQCDNVRRAIQNCIDNIDSLNNEIGSYICQKNDLEIKLLGLETKIANSSEESEVMDYFLRNNNLVLESINNDYITFAVKTYLEYFDDDLAERVIKNKNSYVYKPNGRRCDNIISSEDMCMLMTALFIDQKLRIRFCAAYSISLNGSVSALGRHYYGAECRGYTPNTHIDAYSCLGSYQRTINEFLKVHDYIGAIEQCSASCKSLNFNDSPVMSEFMCRMYGISEYDNINDMRCIELPNGYIATPKEAIEWIKSQKEVSENEQND